MYAPREVQDTWGMRKGIGKSRHQVSTHTPHKVSARRGDICGTVLYTGDMLWSTGKFR